MGVMLFFLCVCYPVLTMFYWCDRYLCRKLVRAARLTQHKYHEVVTKDWWQLYRGRRETRDFDQPSRCSCSYQLAQRDIDYSLNIRISDAPLLVTILRHMTSALICDEIYLRVAHRTSDGFLGNYSVDRVQCMNCWRLLPVSALFLAGYYYCVECIRTELLPRFCGERLWLLREAGLIPYDLVLLVVKYVAYLSFSHSDITRVWDGRHCDCFVYDCQSKEEKGVLRKYLAQYLKLQNKLC